MFDLDAFINGTLAKNPAKYGLDNFKFEGILASAEYIDPFDGGKIKTSYWLIDKTGNALASVRCNIEKGCAFNIETPQTSSSCSSLAEEQKANRRSTKIRDNLIRVIRYYRAPLANSWGEISNMGGMTAICYIDHNPDPSYAVFGSNPSLLVFPSFAREDENFSREIGYTVACKNESDGCGFAVPYREDLSIADNIIDGFYNDAIKYSCGAEAKYKSPLSRALDNGWIA